MNRKLYIILCLLLYLNMQRVAAQDNIGFNFLFLTHHFGGNKMAFLQPNKLDKNAKYVLNWGGVVHYERYIYRKRISLKVAQAMYSDCATLFAGHTHLAFRVNFLNSDRHSLRLGFGPTWVYRETWHRFPDYVQENVYFERRGDWDYVFVWYGGEIEYDYKLSKNWEINAHLIPGVPEFFNLGIGFRYWLNPIPSNKRWRDHPLKHKWFYSSADMRKVSLE